MASIRLQNVSKRFGLSQQYCDVQDLSFEIEDGEFFCFIGPTNSGKTEILRIIAGLEKPDKGHVFINERDVNEVPPSQRQVAMLFETLALYPNKNGYSNIASPLRIKKKPKQEIDKAIKDIAQLLKIEHLLFRNPETYSGGEKQRVALGRLLVQHPNAFLLDEPLGGLDARLRISMRSELKRIQMDLGRTMILVSHDQEEVMSLGNRIAVLKKGGIQQIGSPQDLYRHPANTYVAKTIGKPAMNFYECALSQENGKISAHHPQFSIDLTARMNNQTRPAKKDKVILGIRPEDVEIEDSERKGQLSAEVFISEPLGAMAIVDFKIGEETVRTLVSSDKKFEIKEKKWLRFKEDKLHIFDSVSGNTMLLKGVS